MIDPRKVRTVVCWTDRAAGDLRKIVRTALDLRLPVDLAAMPAQASGIDAVRSISTGSDLLTVESPPGGIHPAWAALRWAVAEDYDRIVALGPYGPDILTKLLSALDDADVVVGSAHQRLATSALASAVGSKAARWLLRIPVRDVMSPVMGFKRHVLEAVDLPSLRTCASAFEVEVKHRAHRLGFELADVRLDGLRPLPAPNPRKIWAAASRVLQMAVRGT